MTFIHVYVSGIQGRPNRKREFTFSGDYKGLCGVDLDDLVESEITYRYNCGYSDITGYQWDREEED